MSGDQGTKGAASLLVVEDDPAMLVALRDILEGSGFIVHTAHNGRAALDLLAQEQPSLILSDISMPVMDGIELFESVRKMPNGTAIPFIFLTARGTREDIFAAKSLGADDYITKPITSQELLSAVRARLQRSTELMLAQLEAAHEVSYEATLEMLANGIESRDPYTRFHVGRVRDYARAIGQELQWDDERLKALKFGAILHDIGKLNVREDVLTKTGPLNSDEWKEMRDHPRVGARMMKAIAYLAPAVAAVLHHHERWDGSGYPDGLHGTEIPESARLLAVVDTFDAMTSDRPYHAAIDPAEACAEIRARSGQDFDPAMVEAFLRCWDRGEIARIMATPVSPPEPDQG
jgi:putative two-component system response regulator